MSEPNSALFTSIQAQLNSISQQLRAANDTLSDHTDTLTQIQIDASQRTQAISALSDNFRHIDQRQSATRARVEALEVFNNERAGFFSAVKKVGSYTSTALGLFIISLGVWAICVIFKKLFDVDLTNYIPRGDH